MSESAIDKAWNKFTEDNFEKLMPLLGHSSSYMVEEAFRAGHKANEENTNRITKLLKGFMDVSNDALEYCEGCAGKGESEVVEEINTKFQELWKESVKEGL